MWVSESGLGLGLARQTLSGSGSGAYACRSLRVFRRHRLRCNTGTYGSPDTYDRYVRPIRTRDIRTARPEAGTRTSARTARAGPGGELPCCLGYVQCRNVRTGCGCLPSSTETSSLVRAGAFSPSWLPAKWCCRLIFIRSASDQMTYADLGLGCWKPSCSEQLLRMPSRCMLSLSSAVSRGVPSRWGGAWLLLGEASSSSLVGRRSLADTEWDGRRPGGRIVEGLDLVGKLLRQDWGTTWRRGETRGEGGGVGGGCDGMGLGWRGQGWCDGRGAHIAKPGSMTQRHPFWRRCVPIPSEGRLEASESVTPPLQL